MSGSSACLEKSNADATLYNGPYQMVMIKYKLKRLSFWIPGLPGASGKWYGFAVWICRLLGEQLPSLSALREAA